VVATSVTDRARRGLQPHGIERRETRGGAAFRARCALS
jgi:hypothetical protein